jgi:hypothetical protein
VPPVRLNQTIAACTEIRPLVCVRHHLHHARVAGVVEAWGYVTPIEFIDAWLASPPHRAIMLDRRYRFAGISMSGNTARIVFST